MIAAHKPTARRSSKSSKSKPSKASTPARSAKPPKTAHTPSASAHALHLRHAAEVEARRRSRDESAPSPLTSENKMHGDTLAEELGEAFVRGATSGEDDHEDVADEVVVEESGGPFVETSSEEEIATGHDASNPPGATREPFPTS